MISVLSGAKHKIAAVCCLIEEDTAGSRLSNTFTTPDSHPYVDIVIQCPWHRDPLSFSPEDETEPQSYKYGYM